MSHDYPHDQNLSFKISYCIWYGSQFMYLLGTVVCFLAHQAHPVKLYLIGLNSVQKCSS